MSNLKTYLGCISSLKFFASSFIPYPSFVTISLNSLSSLLISGSIFKTNALYFFASSFNPSVSCFRTFSSCISHTGPLEEYIKFPKIGIFLISTLIEPIIFPFSSSAKTISFFQASFTFPHSTDC